MTTLFRSRIPGPYIKNPWSIEMKTTLEGQGDGDDYSNGWGHGDGEGEGTGKGVME